MSNHYQRRLSLTGINTSKLTEAELRTLADDVLKERVHGLCFSPYTEGQGPGTQLQEAQIRERMARISPYTRWLRTFSCTEGNELIPAIAAENDLRSMVGIWLDADLENNEAELANAKKIVESGHAGILAVGNEVLLRGDLTEQQLLDYIGRAKAFAGDVPVGYVDAYFEFESHPAITEACDVLLANCYPFWEGCPSQFAILYMKDMYQRAVRAAKGKQVIVTETGWPNIGSPTGAAEPSFENAIKYFVDTCRWAEEDNVEVFYFSAFDESWKVDAEGDVGAFWGLWDKDGTSKFGSV
jgi:exo-beta-1,3-glucanase (GH17 family)